MEIELDLKKSINDNATFYFLESKEMRKKINGLTIAINKNKEQIEKKIKLNNTLEKVKKSWYEKYRWFFTSDGFLVVGGKDAHQNEEIVKKHMDEKDIYFHADVYGAPHCVLKINSNQVNKLTNQSLVEASEFAVTFSKAFEQGLVLADAYSVKPDQVSKRAPSGSSMGVGAFMIYGQRNWFKNTPLSLGVGVLKKENKLMSGPINAIKKNCAFFVELKQGTTEKNQTANELKKIFSDAKPLSFNFSNESFLSIIPNGNFDIKKN
ncbi:MAG: NFACT RNA binding domain-containing protein [Candidatus ainarchaeum sp.]|nr:NFACT RNA binding domain-containing protein [Candidatus ainarchaeum sp.]